MKKLINKYNRLDVVTKASVMYILAGFFQKGISLISGPVFTRLLSQSDYGLFSAYNSWYELIGVVATLSLSAGVYNNGLLEFEQDRDRFTFSLLILSNISTLIVIICGKIGGKHTINLIGLPPNLLLIMGLSFLFSPALTFWTTRQKYEYKYKKASAVTIISTVIAVSGSIIITILSENTNKLSNKIWSEKSLLLIFWIPVYIYLAVKAKCKMKMEYWKYALKFNLPLIPHYLSNYILNSVDRLMIIKMVDPGSGAIYSVAYSAAFLIHIFWESVNAAILPLTYASLKDKKSFENKVIPMLAMYGVVCVLVTFTAPELMTVLAPESYKEGVYLIPILVIGTFLTGLYCLFANVEFYYKSTKLIAVNSILSAMLNIGLNYVCIHNFGYIAAAYTTVICYLVQTVLHYINYRRVSERVYNEKVLVAILSGVISGCLICIPLYRCSVIRYVFLVIIIFFAIDKGKGLIGYYRN